MVFLKLTFFDAKGNLISTFIGKQEELKIVDSINKLNNGAKSQGKIINTEFSVIKDSKNYEFSPRGHG